MSWVKLDDQLHAHPKIAEAWAEYEPSIGLHMLAMSYCGCFGTFGRVPATFVASKIPSAKRSRKATDALVSAGLWDVVEGGWLIHDWAIYNGDAESREAARKAKVEAGKKGAEARWGKPKGDGKPDGTCHSDAMADHMAGGDGLPIAPVPSPVPSQTTDIGGLTSQGCEADLLAGDPGPEEGSNVFPFHDPKTNHERGVA